MNNRCDGDTVALCPLHHIALIKSVSRLSDWHRVCPSTHSIHFCSSSSSTNLLTNLLSQSVFSLSVCAQSYKKELHFLALFAAPNAKKDDDDDKKEAEKTVAAQIENWKVQWRRTKRGLRCWEIWKKYKLGTNRGDCSNKRNRAQLRLKFAGKASGEDNTQPRHCLLGFACEGFGLTHSLAGHNCKLWPKNPASIVTNFAMNSIKKCNK